MRDIIKHYKSYFRSAHQTQQDPASSPDPFLYLRIKCRPGSYDVNIEPAKDEVLFTDTSVVKDCFIRLLVEAYGEIEHPPSRTSRIVHAATKPEANRSFDILLARRQPILHERGTQDDDIEISPSIHRSAEDDVEVQDDPSDAPPFLVPEEEQQAVPAADKESTATSSTRKVFQSMYAADEEDLDEDQPPLEGADDAESFAEDEVERRKATNPWAIAKMNVPVSRKSTHSADPEPSTNSSPSTRPYTSTLLPLLNGPQLLPTPDASPRSPSPYQNPGPPLRRRAKVLEDSPSPTTSMDASRASSQSSQVRTLDKWVQHGVGDSASPTAKFPPADGSQLSTSSSPSNRHSLSPGRSFGSTTTNHRPPFTNFKAPFKPPTRVTSPLRPAKPALQAQNVEDDFEDPGLAEIMEFERRKKAINKQQRQAHFRLGNAPSNPARLAKLQQKALRQSANDDDLDELPSPSSQFSQQSVSYAERFGEDASPNTDHFRSLQASHSSSQSLPVTPSNNPHQNRYLAAKRDLALPYPPLVPATTSLSAASESFSRPRRRRISSRNQPLEQIPSKQQTHNLTQTIPFPTPASLLPTTNTNYGDTYTTTSGNNPGFVIWSAFNMSSTQVKQWQSTIAALVLKHYRAGIIEDRTNSRPDEGTKLSGFEVGLSQAIKAHVEMLAGL